MKRYVTTYSLLLMLILSLNLNAQLSDSIVLCPDLPRLPYYRVSQINELEFKEIKEHFKQGYRTQEMKKLKGNTGILTLRFNINCHAEIGNFDLFSCDLKYDENEMAPEITGYFLQKLKELDHWMAPIDETEGACNLHTFYSFRIVNGEIKEILPK